jgi:hypothetical protein
MSTTKVVIVVLILVALLFVILVTRGALTDDQPRPGNRNDSRTYSKKKEKPGWTKAIKGLSSNRLFSSVVPKLALKQEDYSSSTEEKVLPDKKPFRTATFLLKAGRASIRYKDQTKDAIDDLKDQECPLPNPDSDDHSRCTIIALKGGGTLTFSCEPNSACRVKVE